MTSDPNLLGCELLRLEGTVGLGGSQRGPGEGWRAGVGSYAQETVLLQAFPATETPASIEDLEPPQESPVLLFHTQPQGHGAGEELRQPLRFRSWLFVVGGHLPDDHRWRDSLRKDLPEYLRHQVAALGSADTIFAEFLRHLRETGRTDDVRLPATAAGELLRATANRLGEVMSHHASGP